MIAPLLPVYDRFDITITHGQGVNVWDSTGKKYLDFMGAIAVTAFGHANPRLVEALHTQAKKLWAISNYYKNPLTDKVAQRLVDLTFADTVFFQNSGVEAWELGVKIIRRHFAAKGETQRNRIIVCKGNFHGRTIAAISAVKTPKMVDGFAPLLDGFDQVPYNDLAALEAAITPATAAIHFEPIQGEGGLTVGTIEYLKAVRVLCDKHGLLLYFDEIQCGMGRTGKMFAYEWAGIQPDVMCIAKALGGGFPVGACLATEHAASGMTIGSHGSTYGGNPLAMAVVDEALNILTEPTLLPHVLKMGEKLAAGLDALVAKHPHFFLERRGKGLMQGVKIPTDPHDYVGKLGDMGLLTVGANQNVVRLLPPLVVSESEIDEALNILDKSVV